MKHTGQRVWERKLQVNSLKEKIGHHFAGYIFLTPVPLARIDSLRFAHCVPTSSASFTNTTRGRGTFSPPAPHKTRGKYNMGAEEVGITAAGSERDKNEG